MIRITSLNLNGIRSAFTKGLENWLATHRPDIVCMQETKAHLQDIKEELRHPLDYTGHFCSAEKKGYSGVGIYLKAPAERVANGMECEEFDAEGRIIRADFANLSVISAYLPSGSSGPERLRRLEHRTQGNRSQKLEIQPKKLRISSRGARMADARHR